MLAPAFEHPRHLAAQELEEGQRLGHAGAGRAVAAEGRDALARGLLPALEQPLAPRDRLVPGVVVDVVAVAPRAGLAVACDQPHLREVANGAGDRSRAGPQALGQLGGREAARVGRQQGDEDAGGHAREARLAFIFIFFILAASLFACAQIGAARNEEEQRLETLLVLPIGRIRWLGGRLLVAAAGTMALAFAAGFFAWAGAASAGVDVSLADMLEAGANCLPISLLFLGLAALAYAVVPRSSAGVAYGLVTVAFVWQLVGSIVDAPRWLLDVTPFAHVGLVPTQSFRLGAAAIMIAVGAAGAAGALELFRRRDVLGS